MIDPRNTREHGNALVIAVLLVVVMVGLAMAMMTTALHDRQQSRAATEHTRGLYVAEAGINHAIADLAAGGNAVLGAPNAMLDFGGGSYWVACTANPDGSYTIVASSALAGEQQAIEVVVKQEVISIFTMGLFGDLDIGATGNVFTDSYDSDLGDYASQATNVDPVTGRTYAGSKGSLGSNGDIRLRGGVIVMGDATPGPGCTVKIGGPGVHVAGTTTPAESVTPLPPVQYSPSIGTSGALTMSGGTLTLTAGSHRYDSMTLDDTSVITIQGEVDLYVDGDVEMTGQAQIALAPGARLTIHHGGDLLQLTGLGILNSDEDPSRFVVYSEATSVKLTGTAGLYGSVYAPAAVIEPVGTSTLYGSFVGSQVFVGGTADFHYDERLARDADLSTPGNFRVESWRKVPFGSLPSAPVIPGP